MDADEFKDYFNTNKTANPELDTATIMTLQVRVSASLASSCHDWQGRCYPVEVFYLETPTPDYLKCATATVFALHNREPKGDILLFLTGQEEVRCNTLLTFRAASVCAP